MALELNKLKEILKKPSKTSTISKATRLQKRLRFHTEANVSLQDIAQPANEFLNWVSKFLPKDKFHIFTHLFSFPLATNEVIDEIYRELERVFFSRNSSTTYQFTSSELAEDWQKYRIEKLNEPEIWKSKGWTTLKVSPNSILVVDAPKEQTTDRPEPYFYWLDLSRVFDYGAKEDGTELEWLIFYTDDSKTHLTVIDDESYRIIEIDDSKRSLKAVLHEAKHPLKYCPARFFWSTPLNDSNKEIKKNPIVKELSNLDWYLFFLLSKRHLDTYAPYPIYSAYEADCNFENNETGDYCDGGFLRDVNGNFKFIGNNTLEKCPKCSDKRIAGPGSFLEVPVPNVAEGIADLSNPVKITTIDDKSLNYNVKECERLKDEIIISVVGSGGSVSEKEAINETQVSANFESKTSVLNNIKTDFELAQKFVDDTICKLRYADGFISSSISWGTEFYVFTVKELYTKYEKAKACGASEAELSSITTQILEVEYKNNPQVLQRMLVLKQLEPYQHKTLAELTSLADLGLVTQEKLILKLNFSSYIDRFERENINIVEFGSNLSMSEKVKIINEKLLSYVREDQKATAGGPAGQT